jgi:hypothetical protein
MSKFYPLGTKNKRNFFVGMKTSDFILQGRKPKLIIKVRTKNIFYPIFNLDNNNMRDRSKAMLKKVYFFGGTGLTNIFQNRLTNIFQNRHQFDDSSGSRRFGSIFPIFFSIPQIIDLVRLFELMLDSVPGRTC